MSAGLLALLAACGGAPVDPPCTDCVLTDAMNYHYAPTLTAPVRPVPSRTDPRIVWDGLTHDLQGHPVDAASLDSANLLVFRDLTPDEVLDRVAHDQLAQSELRIIASCTPEVPSCRLSDFALGANRFDPSQYFEPDSGTWLVSVSRAGTPGSASLLFLEPQDAAPVVEDVVVADGDATLALDVRFSAERPAVVAEGAPALDWSGLTVDALGNDVELSRFDQLYVARYDEDLATLARDFLDVEQLAEDSWQLDVAGRTGAALSELEAFPGVDAAHRWLLALRCTTCRNPAPRFVTVLDPVAEEVGR